MEEIGDARAEHLQVGGKQAARCRGRDAQSQSGPLRGTSRVERDRVLVGRDAGAGERGLRLLTQELHRSEIEQHHWSVGAAADDPDPAVGERSRVLDDALSVGPELRAKGLAQAHRLVGEDVGVKASLRPRMRPRMRTGR